MTTGTRGRNLPLWKKALFSALMLGLVIGVIEAAAYVAGSMATQGHFSHRRLQAQRNALVASGGRPTVRPRWIQDEVVHPYVGYVPLSRAADGGLGVARALLSLGERFDILINLDGFNDIVLHPTENAPAGVSPVYPRRWHQRVEGMLAAGALRLMFQRVLLEQRRAGLAPSSRRRTESS